MPFDDDIKIFKNSDYNDDNNAVVTEVVTGQNQFDSALALGHSLVNVILSNKDADSFSYLESFVVTMQIKMLLAFSICSAIEESCTTPHVANTALNSFYNSLKAEDPTFYEDLSSSGAISFYYLALRRGIEVERRIGQTFAMLCSEDGNDIYQEIGETLYCKFVNTVKNEIEKFGLLKK